MRASGEEGGWKRRQRGLGWNGARIERALYSDKMILSIVNAAPAYERLDLQPAALAPWCVLRALGSHALLQNCSERRAFLMAA